MIDGERVVLQMRIYKPGKKGKRATLVLNYGSTGSVVSGRLSLPASLRMLSRLSDRLRVMKIIGGPG